jgi:hypothetical protein
MKPDTQGGCGGMVSMIVIGVLVAFYLVSYY